MAQVFNLRRAGLCNSPLLARPRFADRRFEDRMFLYLRIFCTLAAILALICGSLGLAASFLFLSAKNPADNLAGVAGFIAGAILVSGGLISLSVLSIARSHGATEGLVSPSAVVDQFRVDR